jgi:hypothetical protein
MKFTKAILSAKKKWINSLNDRKVVSINEIERISLKYLLITTNFEDYCNNKVNKKRRIYSIIYCLFVGLFALRFLLAAFITDSELWILMGDAFYSAGERVLLNILFFLISFGIFLGRASFLICK